MTTRPTNTTRRNRRPLGRTLRDIATPTVQAEAAPLIPPASMAELIALRAEVATLRAAQIRRAEVAAITIRDHDGTAPGAIPAPAMRLLCERIAARRRRP
jgi:hypothetical protein